MDKGRQQCNRNSRYNMRNSYQQNTNYGNMMYGKDAMDCGCNASMQNQYVVNNTCNCADDCPSTSRDPLGGMPLAMGYVPWQQFENLYEDCEALYHGTIFCDLDLDFYGMRCE